jgi:hypothetical protein
MAQVERPVIAWSHSALNLYNTCPRKFYEAKITKAWVEEFKGPAAEWGLAVHKAFERRIRFGTPFPANMVQWEPLARKLSGIAGTIATEMQFAINNKREEVDWFAKDAWCRAIGDFLSLNLPKRKMMALDYKTGKRKDDDSQLALLAAVIFDIHENIDTVIAGYVWLKDGAKLDMVTFTREHKDQLWDIFLPQVAKIEQSVTSGHWPEKQSGLCHGYCPVKDCQFWHPKKER